MTAQKGKDLLLKIDSKPAGTFTTVAGLRARRLSFNAGAVDITNASSTGNWRELLEGAGIKSASLSGAGVFKDVTCDELIRSVFFSGEIRIWEVVIPHFGAIKGLFQITGLEFAGEHDGEVTYELSLESAGSVSFVPA